MSPLRGWGFAEEHCWASQQWHPRVRVSYDTLVLMPSEISMRLRFQSVILGAVPAMLVLLVQDACRAQTNAESSAQFAQWGVETLDAIQRDLWIADQGLYAEKAAADGERPTVPAFMWGAGVQLSALAAAARVDSAAYAAPLAAYADALQSYWVEHNGIGGYSVLPGQRVADRYYDDNAWVVLGLIETAAVTDDAKYLERAEATQRFVLSGEDDSLGGGVYWRENRRNSKNTCSNAPAIVGALLLHQKTTDPQQLAAAQRLYKWTQEHLQDPEDGLYWDNVRRGGRVDRRKFSYNSALMMRANCLLYEIKGEAKYLAEAQRIARAAETQWIVPETGAVKDGGKFGHMLLEAFVAVGRADRDPHWLDVARKSATYVHANVRDPNGRYAHRWDRPQGEALGSYMLIDQASAARVYFVIAEAAGEDNRHPTTSATRVEE
jgi:uncharacterized protein YyaL (SSP411 family)